MDNIPAYIFYGIALILCVACNIRFLVDKCSPVKTVKATVVHKQTVERYSKYSGTGKRTSYAVTFQAGDKRLSFFVSEFSYRGYKVEETGTLKYKGSRLIDFS